MFKMRLLGIMPPLLTFNIRPMEKRITYPPQKLKIHHYPPCEPKRAFNHRHYIQIALQ